jgi:glycosyltransferase involved in cell wall biosynthesis
MEQIDLSIVVPVYNEEDNLRPLLAEITAALKDEPITYEVIFIDDGSRDGSFAVMKTLHREDNRVVAIQFRRNHGQTAAFAAGFDQARGRYILTMDADRQNDPADIPAMLKKLREGYDVVNGWRENRQDAFLMRKLPSFIANRLIARLSDVPLRDRGCSLRVFRAEVTNELKLYGELHRFIPEMVSFAGFSMAEVPVNHRARVAGKSKYGISRTFRVIVDLITILFLRKYSDRPMHLFGMLGISFSGLGVLLGLYLSWLKVWAGIQAEPLLAGLQQLRHRRTAASPPGCFAGYPGRAVPGDGPHRRIDGAHLLRVAEQDGVLHSPGSHRRRRCLAEIGPLLKSGPI